MNFIKQGDQSGNHSIQLFFSTIKIDCHWCKYRKFRTVKIKMYQKIGDCFLLYSTKSMNMVNIQLDLMNLSLHIV